MEFMPQHEENSTQKCCSLVTIIKSMIERNALSISCAKPENISLTILKVLTRTKDGRFKKARISNSFQSATLFQGKPV